MVNGWRVRREARGEWAVASSIVTRPVMLTHTRMRIYMEREAAVELGVH